MKDIIILLIKSKRFISGFILFVFVLTFGLLGPVVYPQDPFKMVGGLFSPPSEKYILGTDNLGRDVFVELMHGIRTSLLIGATAGVIATLIGVSIGSFAGYKGGLIEEILMGITNVLITIPPIVILILLSVAIKTRTAITMGIVIGVTAWPWTARAVRAQTSSLKTREHIELAKITGFNTFEMIVFEILPYMFSYIFMAFILQFSSGVLNEA
ncbi:MAG: ABC transporter permease, partial [candidate division WOR-3 bacterium]